MGLTKHGEKRIRKRNGLKRKAAARQAEQAISDGLPRDDATGNLRKYMDSKYYSHTSCYLCVHSADLYVFSSKGGQLVTVYPLPGGLRNSALAQQKRRAVE